MDQLPECRKCQKPVARFVRWQGRRMGPRHSFRAECHGEVDEFDYRPRSADAGARYQPSFAFPFDPPDPDLVADPNAPIERTLNVIMDEIEALPETAIIQRIEYFQTSISLLEKNAADLTALLTFLSDDPRSFELSAAQNRAALDAAGQEVLRLLHNFVASALTLVDHTRVLWRQLHEPDRRFPDYEQEAKLRFAENPNAQFVQKLRHLAQHVRLPAMTYAINFKEGEPLRRLFVLLKNDLSKWDGWTVPARAYLESLDEKIDMRLVVSEYLETIRSFYEWMAGRLAEIHASDYAKVNEKKAEFRSLLAKDIPGLIESGLARFLDGKSDLRDAFAAGLGAPDWVELAAPGEDLAGWVDRAIALMEERFGALPADLIARLKKAAAE